MAEVEKQPRLDSCHKARVLLSVLKCACFEHLEGEQLFTAICAGYGRFECERLLKPSGVELMNLPRSANIEVSVLRRSGDRERPKQLLYHGMVSLSQVFPSLDSSASAQGAEAAGGIEGCGNADVAWMDQPQVWENWLGLFSSDVNLKAQSPERLFQRCQEMGASGARFPRLLLRLQRLPPGVPAAAAQRALGQSIVSAAGSGAFGTGAAAGRSETAAGRQEPSQLLPPTSASTTSGASLPATTTSAAATTPPPVLPRQAVEELRGKLVALELENARLRERDASVQVLAAEDTFWMRCGSHGATSAAARSTLTSAAVPSTAATSEVDNGEGAAPGRPILSLADLLYRPVYSDPIDCLLASALLRLGTEGSSGLHLGFTALGAPLAPGSPVVLMAASSPCTQRQLAMRALRSPAPRRPWSFGTSC